jgi:P4 family phage/plasmid primase-like protien
MKKYKKQMFEKLISSGFELFPLVGKVPKNKGSWRTSKPLTLNDLTSSFLARFNAGIRIPPGMFVVDVDSWHPEGVNSYEKLKENTGLESFDLLFPTTVTGGKPNPDGIKGSHSFMRLPDPDMKMRWELPKVYPGIQTKQHGGYVVAPGSIHPDTGKPYVWDELTDWYNDAPVAPESIIGVFKKVKRSSSPSVNAFLTAEEVGQNLEQLDPEMFDSNEAWLNLAMSVHYACKGDSGARDIFLSWCRHDPRYNTDDFENRNYARWESFSVDDSEDLISTDYFYKLVTDTFSGQWHGQSPKLDVLEEFAEDFDDDHIEFGGGSVLSDDGSDDSASSGRIHDKKMVEKGEIDDNIHSVDVSGSDGGSGSIGGGNDRRAGQTQQKGEIDDIFNDSDLDSADSGVLDPLGSKRSKQITNRGGSSGDQNIRQDEGRVRRSHGSDPTTRKRKCGDEGSDQEVDPEKPRAEQDTKRPKYQELIDTLTVKSSKSEIDRVLKLAAAKPDLEAVCVRDVARKSDLGKRDIRSDIRRFRIELMNSKKAKGGEELDEFKNRARGTVHYLAMRTLAKRFKKGKTLIYAKDGTYWTHHKTHWSKVSGAWVQGRILQEARRHQDRVDPDATVGNLGSIESIIRAERAQRKDTFNKRAPSIINCQNGEVEIDDYTGEVKFFEKHRPEKMLLNCLDLKYDPSAKCPRMDDFLDKLFEPDISKDDTIRHLWELIGYTIQPNKNIPSWWLFYGPRAANGKSTLIKIIQALVGFDQYVSKPLKTMDNTHATAGLIGKLLYIEDDLAEQTVLPEILKSISEIKKITVNPKSKDEFNFVCTLSLILGSNYHPRISDTTDGTLRRANVFEFNQKFPPGVADIYLADKITNDPEEMSGILNRALAGLQRLRKRKKFEPSKGCQEAERRWMVKSNNYHEFIETMLLKSKTSMAPWAEVFAIHELWCEYQGIERRFRTTRAVLKAKMERNGIVFKRGSRNVMFVHGYEINKEEVDILRQGEE